MTHSLHTTTDKLSRHAYTLPCPTGMRGGSYYDAVDTIDVQAPYCSGWQHDSAEDTPPKDLETRFVRWSTTRTTLRTAIPKRASAEVVETVTNCSSRTTYTTKDTDTLQKPGHCIAALLLKQILFALLCFHRISK
jgi:hypothetical protein